MALRAAMTLLTCETKITSGHTVNSLFTAPKLCAAYL